MHLDDMCGIAGVLHERSRNPVSARRVDAMVDALTHRGPDDRGCHRDSHAAIGARRLSIIDVEGGHQPMYSDDGRVVVVYNGECYNHEALRRELQSLGAAFRTRCDTEVVLHGFRCWGARGLAERMNGIYAFCVWERDAHRAWIVRDRLGVKPLYYVDRNGRFAFSSELRSVALSGLVTSKIDETALWGYLGYQFAPAERSLLNGVFRLAPGHLLEWHDGRVRTEAYWELPNRLPDEGADWQERTAALRELLGDVLDGQMMSDGPVGCFLSGGLDSTIVAAMMVKRSTEPLRTFSIAFPETPDCDESAYFERMAAELGAQHHTIDFSQDAVLRELPRFAWAMDEPVADPAMLPTYLLAQAAAWDVKVVLTGEGADEVFAGYPYYRAFVRRGGAGRTEAAAGRSPRERALHWARLSRALSKRLGRVVPAPRNDESSPVSGFPYALDPDFVWSLLHPDRRPEEHVIGAHRADLERRALKGLTHVDPLQAALALDTKLWLANDLMPKLDKMTMAHGLEGRVPFLDHRLVEFAFLLPDRFKVGDEHGKRILREAVDGIIPPWMKHRAKHGFNVPLYQWFRGPLQEFARDSLLEGGLAETGLFDRTSLEALFVAHTELDLNVARPLWQLICLGRWHERLCREMADVVSPVGDAPAVPEAGAELPTHGGAIEVGRCDIVVPIYGGVTYVRDLLRSIERHTRYPHRILLIDDSEDDATHAELKRLAEATPHAELHRNEKNMGFVGTSNRGFSLGRSEYVCLLNSDTLVTEGWLERMIACAEHDPRVAIVNPLSNKSVNLSVAMAPGLNLNTMARRVFELSRREYPDITTAVGFCMLIKRRHLDWLGGFDPVYGQGYCEESDLCMRYTEAGLRVVIADDAFVYHKGCGSFGTWLDRYAVNREIFDARWAEAYARDYRGFLTRNPIQYVRDSLLRHTVPAEAWPPGEGDAGEGDSLPRTDWNPENRAMRFPTPTYVRNLARTRLPRLDGEDEKLRITFLVASMPIAGGITSIVQLAREMALAGHDVRLVTETQELEPERFNLPVQPLVYPDRDTLVRCFPESDVVVATYWTTAADYLEELQARYDFVSVYFLQDYEVWFYPEEDRESRDAVADTYRLADHRIVKSRWLKDLVSKNHRLGCDWVRLGLDLGIFWDRTRSAEVNDVPRIVSVARPSERRRGFLETVDVFDRIHRARPEVELVFFGTSDEDMPDHLPFPYRNEGVVPDLNKVAELISSADVLVDSSLFQGFGRPGIEAMACGTPCVLTPVGGIGEYARDGENCLMVNSRLTGRMSETILRLLDDPGLRERLRARGLETAARYSHVEEAREHLRLYRKWVDERAKR